MLTGIGLRPHYYNTIEAAYPKINFLEIHSENLFCDRMLYQKLFRLKDKFSISMHGVNLSLGSVEQINKAYLADLKKYINVINPVLVSDHLAFSAIDNIYYHDFLPLPYTEEALNHICGRIEYVQSTLNQLILIENISNYVSYKHSVITEGEFIREILSRTGCQLLLDINNVYFSTYNLKKNPDEFLKCFNSNMIGQYHLAGYSETIINSQKVLIDSHDHEISEEVWALFQKIKNHFGDKPLIIEWDSNYPSLSELVASVEKSKCLN